MRGNGHWMLGLLLLAPGCNALPYFENAPECTLGETRTRGNSCGPCMAGTLTEWCGPGRQWQPDSCVDETDRDADGFPNYECVLGELVDCNDDDPTAFPRATGLEECWTGTTEACTMACGTPGTRTCDPACMWQACTAPEACGNGVDDDCDTQTDEIEPGQCSPGTSTPCTTSCGSTGTGTCTDACTAPDGAACESPEEVCNSADDDCDTETDERPLFCRPGQTVSCTTTCGSAGTGICTDACERPVDAACTPPVETCDGTDEDCDTATDEGMGVCIEGRTRPCTTPEGAEGIEICDHSCSWGDCTTEICNGLDDDRDGLTDEDWTELEALCDGADDDRCEEGNWVCNDLFTGVECNDDDSEHDPEACNNRDDDCDGATDEAGGAITCQPGTPGPCGTCPGARSVCTSACVWGACVPPAETCNGRDDDCNGLTDESRGLSATCNDCLSTAYAGHTYQLCFGTALGWDAARDTCTAMGGRVGYHLATIETQAEATALATAFGPSTAVGGAWIGFSQDRSCTLPDYLCVWSWLTGGASACCWDSPANPSVSADDCAMLTLALAPPGKFDDRDCSWAIGYLCEYP